MSGSKTTDVPLDPLPFGNGSAIQFDGVGECTAFLERNADRPSLFDALGPEAGFRLRLRPVVLPQVAILAGSSTPKTVDHRSRRAALVIPFGDCGSTVRIDRTDHAWASPHQAFFIPAGVAARAESTAGSFLRLDIDHAALAVIAAGMIDALDPAAEPIDLDTARTVPLHAWSCNWPAHWRAICASIEALGCDAVAIERAGLDDVILRTIVMMLRPDLFAPVSGDRMACRGFELDSLLERLMAHLGEPITLSRMEAWTDRTARAIQLAFQKRFGVGPMQWLRQRRLDAIRARLSSPAETASVRQIAGECGIQRMATLVAEYSRRFGEKPAETRARRAR